jgi:hypothetical protein
MSSRKKRWLTAQEAAVILDTTSAEVCRLLSLGRLTGTKQKHPKRPGQAQWLVDPRSISGEKRRAAKRLAAEARRRKPNSRASS